MISIQIFQIICLSLTFQLLSGYSQNSAPFPELESFMVERVSHKIDLEPGIQADLLLFHPVEIDRSKENHPAILYLINHGGVLAGNESCLSILTDFLEEGYILAVLDLKQDPSTHSSDLDWTILNIRNDLAANRLFQNTELSIDPFQLFVIPEGYRLLRDHVYWEIDRHGVDGTMEYILSHYNRFAVSQRNAPFAESIEDLRKPNGEPFDYKLRMDIVYPSHSKELVPVVVFQSSSSPRKRWQTNRPHYIGFKLRGYAFAHYDHNYIPTARDDHYGFFGSYSLDSWNGVASNTAAIRAIRAVASNLNLEFGEIGISGHSKASYGAALLSDPGHVNRAEWSHFSNSSQSSPEPQPWPGFSSNVSVNYQSMGDGTQRHRSLVGDDYAPTILASGEWDRLTAAQYWAEQAYHFKRSEVPHLAMFMRGIGHTMPYGTDDELGIDRYDIIFNFFKPYLRPERSHPPVLLYQLPLDQAQNVCPQQPIQLRFAAGIDPRQFDSSQLVRIVSDKQDEPISGKWHVRQRNTYFEWHPCVPLEAHQKYTLVIEEGLHSMSGGRWNEDLRIDFYTGKIKEKEVVEVDWERRKNDLLYQIEDSNRPPFGGWPIPGKTVDALPAFSIDPYTSLHYTAGYHIVHDQALKENSGRRFLRWRTGRDASIRIDLGETRKVSQLILTSGTDSGEELVRNFRLRYSNTSTEELETLIEVTDNEDRRLMLNFGPVHGRWFEIDAIDRASPVRIHDLELYEVARQPEPNLRLTASPTSKFLSPMESLKLTAFADNFLTEEVYFYHNNRRIEPSAHQKGNRFIIDTPALPAGFHIFFAKDKPNGIVTEMMKFVVLPGAYSPLIDEDTPFTLKESGGWQIDGNGPNGSSRPILRSPSRSTIFLDSEPVKNSVIEVRVRILQLQSRFGILFRASDASSQNAFGVTFQSDRVEVTAPQTISRQAIQRVREVSIENDKSYLIRLKVYENHLQVFIEGQLVLENLSLPVIDGLIGFLTQNAEIEIQSINISPIP